MLDFSLMLQVKLPVVDRIQPQCIATGVENQATGDLKLNDRPANCTDSRCHQRKLCGASCICACTGWCLRAVLCTVLQFLSCHGVPVSTLVFGLCSCQELMIL